MPFRKDHLQLVTDAGATLDIGWDYGTPYSLDPINGVDVNLQKAQGVNQIGETVERQSVAGVSRELIIHCHSPHGDADAELLLEKLPYFTSGTMYFEDRFFCRFVLSKTPYTKSIHPYPVLAFMLFCRNPAGTTCRLRASASTALCPASGCPSITARPIGSACAPPSAG